MNTSLSCRRLSAALLLSVAAFAHAALASEITPLQIEQTTEARFPNALSFSPVLDGEARVVISVDERGRLTDLLVTGYTEKPFADEAAAALRQWRYEPARENGQPISVRVELRFKFSATGRVISLSPNDTLTALTQNLIRTPLTTRICPVRELDQPLATVSAVAPNDPGMVRGEETQRHSVLVDFYVDDSGTPRMPVVENALYPAYAQAAVDALVQWRFTAPRRAGKKMSVRLRQEFIFLARS